MSVKHLNYLDLPEDRRREAASKAKAQLEMLLDSTPNMPPKDAAILKSRIAHLDRWALGRLRIEPSKEHNVQLKEDIPVKER